MTKKPKLKITVEHNQLVCVVGNKKYPIEFEPNKPIPHPTQTQLDQILEDENEHSNSTRHTA